MTTQTQPVCSIEEELLEFESDEFQAAARPHCQWFNDEHYGGLLIKESDAESVGFDADLATEHGYEWINWRFGDDEENEAVNCLVTPNPILCVLRSGPLKMYDRKSGELVGLYDGKTYRREKHTCKTRYLIYQLAAGEDGYQLLHAEPLVLTLKGSIGAAFGKKGGPLDSIEKAVQKHYGRKTPPFAFSVHLQVQSEERTEESSGETYWLSSIIDAEPVTTKEQLASLYVGKQVLQVLASAYENHKGFE